jgi:hypothetical protein
MTMPARLMEQWARRLHSAPHPCHDCGCFVAWQTGYRFYADEGPQVLCASCYQKRLMTATGGRTHDLAAQVVG